MSETIGIIIITAIILGIRYVIRSGVNKGTDIIENAIKNNHNKQKEEQKQNGEDTSSNLADRFK